MRLQELFALAVKSDLTPRTCLKLSNSAPQRPWTPWLPHLDFALIYTSSIPRLKCILTENLFISNYCISKFGYQWSLFVFSFLLQGDRGAPGGTGTQGSEGPSVRRQSWLFLIYKTHVYWCRMLLFSPAGKVECDTLVPILAWLELDFCRHTCLVSLFSLLWSWCMLRISSLYTNHKSGNDMLC